MLLVKFSSKKFSKLVCVTTPIFYVNSKPHIGHLYSAILASAVKNVNLLQEKLVIMSSGTDEHGLKIQQKAKSENISTQSFCDKYSSIFMTLFDKAKIDYDFFIRTTSESHEKVVYKFWTDLMKEKQIEKYDYSGFYSVQEESFIPEKDLIKEGDKYYTSLSIHSKQPVEFLSEQNYKIIFSEQNIQNFFNQIKSEKINFIPKNLINEVKGYLSIKDLCISRPKNRVTWGIQVPNDEENVIYVWFEALLNYLTLIELHTNADYRKNLDNVEFIHIIGKDISKFHCFLWPLILQLNNAMPYKLNILMHNYWLKNETKMSKSIGNVVDPDLLINKYGIDAIRFYFLAAGPLLHDISFEEKVLKNVFYRCIPDSFINLLIRLSNSNIVDFNKLNTVEDFTKEFEEKIEENIIHVNNAKQDLCDYNFVNAAQNVHNILLNLNNIVHNSEFWKRSGEDEYLRQLGCFIIEFIRIISVLFYPYLPELMGNVHKFIGVEEKYIKLKFCFFRMKVDSQKIDNLKKNSINRSNNDREIMEFNNLSETHGYFRIDQNIKNRIFINKVK
jgi:methionyl-tRNA synthetase